MLKLRHLLCALHDLALPSMCLAVQLEEEIHEVDEKRCI